MYSTVKSFVFDLYYAYNLSYTLGYNNKIIIFGEQIRYMANMNEILSALISSFTVFGLVGYGYIYN